MNEHLNKSFSKATAAHTIYHGCFGCNSKLRKIFKILFAESLPLKVPRVLLPWRDNCMTRIPTKEHDSRMTVSKSSFCRQYFYGIRFK